MQSACLQLMFLEAASFFMAFLREEEIKEDWMRREDTTTADSHYQATDDT